MAEQTTVPVKTTDGAKAAKTQLARWDPIEMLEALQGEVGRLWGEAWPLGPWTTRRPLHQTGWTPWLTQARMSTPAPLWAIWTRAAAGLHTTVSTKAS